MPPRSSTRPGSAQGTGIADADSLPPVQYLIMHMLAVRWCLGVRSHRFPRGLRGPAEKLDQAGLLDVGRTGAWGTFSARITPAGRAAMGAALDSVRYAGAAELWEQVKPVISSDGSWPGGDLVPVVDQWLCAHGIDTSWLPGC